MTSVGGVKGNNQFSKRVKPEIAGVDIVTAGGKCVSSTVCKGTVTTSDIL